MKGDCMKGGSMNERYEPSTASLTYTTRLHLHAGKKGTLQLRPGGEPTGKVADVGKTDAGRVPRLARLMALAIRFETLIRAGEVTDYADLARLGHVTRARVTQIMNLLLLAPKIQEEILFLPTVVAGREPLKEWHVRPIVAELRWGMQSRSWAKLKQRVGI